MRIEMTTSEELQKKLALAQHQLEIIKMVNDELITELDLEKLLKSVASRAREIVDAETLVIPVINSHRTKYTYKAAEGKNALLILNQTFPVSAGMCGWVLSHQESLIFARDLPWKMDEKTLWEEGMESALLVPLISRGQIVGGLSALGKQGGGSFTREDCELLQIFANQISVAIDNAQIFQELTEEKERTETTLNSIGDAVITTDVEGIIVRANPIACSLLGWQINELLGQHLSDVFKIYNSETREPVDDPVVKVIASGEIVGLANHTVLVSHDGTEYQIADSAAPIRNEQNQLLGVVLVFHDVTEEYALLSELRESEQKHRRLIEHLGNEFFMFIQNVEGEMNYFSPSVFDCLGYTPEELLRNYKSYLTGNEINNQIDLKFTEALGGQKPEPFEIAMKNKQGDECILRVSETPILDRNNQVIAIEGLVQNITEQRELEQSVRQSQKMEAVGQLSGGIAHDFNNQLGVVMGYLDMLKEKSIEGSGEQRWIETAINASQRCVELTQGLLNFSRKKNISQSLVNINQSILSMQNMLEHSITAAIELKLQLEPKLWDVVIDDGELQDVILNLIINARDAMPLGGAIWLLTENIVLHDRQSFYINHLNPGSYIKLSVIDSGTGMNQQTLERIFEPFYTTKSLGQGTGLGMPMVFGFVNRVHGAIDVQSAEGTGTRIDIYVPKARQSIALQETKKQDVDLPQGKESILLVEDEYALRDLAEEFLNSQGYQVYTAENATQAIDILNLNIEIDLLFSDVVMPGGIDGYHLAEQAKKIRPEIKVLLATGYTSHANADDKLTDQIDCVLYKPYSRSILTQRVRRVLDNKL